jgi:hypothetical protein
MTSDSSRGRHGAARVPWLQRPRPPFRMNGFTLRLVIPVLVLGPVLLTAGAAAVVGGEHAGGAVQLALGMLTTSAAVAYFARPVTQ